jgi:hypothetical protein
MQRPGAWWGGMQRETSTPIPAFRVSGLGFRVSGLGSRVSGLGFGVWGLGFGVQLVDLNARAWGEAIASGHVAGKPPAKG